MNVTVSFYDPNTGLFTGRRRRGPREHALRAVPKGLAAIEGRYDRHTQRVDVETGNVVAYERPAAELEAEQRAKRDRHARERIAALERAQHRSLREIAIDPANAEARGRLDEIEREIAGLRGDLA
jgi:hypothetical protein